MKVLMLTDTFIPVVGGAQFRWHNVANYLTEEGVKVTVLTRRRSSKKALKNFYPIKYNLFCFPYPLKLGQRPRIIKILTYFWGGILLLFGRYDIIHANMLYPTGWIAYRLGKFFKKPVVVTVAGEDVNSVVEINYGSLTRSEEARRCSLHLITKISAVVGMSPSLCDTARKLGAKNTVLIPNGIPRQLILETPKKTKTLESLSLISIARNAPVKNLKPIVEAFGMLKGAPIHLTMVGKGVGEFCQLAEKLGITDQLTFIESLAQDSLFKLLSESDVLISNSLMEGAPQVVQQAIAMRKDIIVSDVPGNRDFVVNGIGVLINPCSVENIADAIKKSLNDKLSGKSEQSKKREVNLIEWCDVAKLHVQLYYNVLNGEDVTTNYSWTQ